MRLFGNAIQQYYGTLAISAPPGGAALTLSGSGTTPALSINNGSNTPINLTDGTMVGQVQMSGSSLQFGTVTNNNMSFFTNNATRFLISAAGGLFATGATGGDKGVGTGNFTGLFVNGTAVSTAAGFTPQVVTLGSASTKTSNTTIAVDGTLQVTVPSAGTYRVELYCGGISGMSPGQGGIALTFGLSAANFTQQGAAMASLAPVDGTPTQLCAGNIVNAPTVSNTAFLPAAAFSIAPSLTMIGMVTLTASTTVGVWWAQSTTSAAGTSIPAGSTLVVTRVS